MFAKLIFGHLLGDYIIQPKNMAIKKSEKFIKGFLYCFCHCIIYTLSIFLFVRSSNIIARILVFANHYIIDRYSLTLKWLDFINGRNFIKEFESKEKYRDINLIFSCIVYLIVDNAFHLIFNYYVIQYFMKGTIL